MTFLLKLEGDVIFNVSSALAFFRALEEAMNWEVDEFNLLLAQWIF